MPANCIVPGCGMRYGLGIKVHMFLVPRDDELRKVWLRLIRRENFVPSKYASVCARHFTDADIIWKTSYTDVATGRVLTSTCVSPRLRRDAVPSKFLDMPCTEPRRPMGRPPTVSHADTERRPREGKTGWIPSIEDSDLKHQECRDTPDAKKKAVAQSTEAETKGCQSEGETDSTVSKEDPRTCVAIACELQDADEIQILAESNRASSSVEDADRILGAKDSDGRRMHPKPKRKRQKRRDADTKDTATKRFRSEDGTGGCPGVKGSDWRQTGLDSNDVQTAVAKSIETLSSDEETDGILGMEDLADYVRSKQSSAFWHTIEANERLLFVHIVKDEVPWIKYSVVLRSDFTLTCHVLKTPVAQLGSNLCIPNVVKSKKAVMKLLESIEDWDGSLDSSSEHLDEDICEAIHLLPGKLNAVPTEDQVHAIQFLSEQLKLLSSKMERRRYSADFMVFSCLLFTLSPCAYKYIYSCGSIILPMTIRSICSSFEMNSPPEHQSATFLNYVAKRISDLDGRQRYVTVMVDEIHIKAFYEYKGGGNTDVAPDSAGVANTAFVFTVQSLTCQFKEVAHVVPVKTADAQFLHNVLSNVICGLERIGYRVTCVVGADNLVNRTAMSHFASPPTNGFVYPHPSDPARPLFFVLDPVHILKSIHNDWLNQSNDQLCFHFPQFQTEPTRAQRMLSASLATIGDAYNLESYQLVKYGYSLSSEALFPTDVKRGNLRLALQIFNDSLPQTLRALGVKQNLRIFEETAVFIEIVAKWWKIVTVKAPDKGKTPKDPFEEPVFSSHNDPRVDFLYKLLDWLDEWTSKDLDSGTLTNETHAALQQTTRALVEISKYCIAELKLPFVLLGKIQTENLEERFGTCKQVPGSQYHPSIRQLYEGEDEVLVQDALATSAGACGADGDAEDRWEDLLTQEHTSHPNCDVAVTREALSKIEDIVPVLVYVAGHAVHATLKKLDCSRCRDALTLKKTIAIPVAPEHYKLVRELNAGGIPFPTMFALNAVAYSYVVVEQLSRRPEFLEMPNKRRVVVDLTLQLLTNEETSEFDTCEDGHSCEFVLKHVLWCCSNVVLKSFSSEMTRKYLNSHRKS